MNHENVDKLFTKVWDLAGENTFPLVEHLIYKCEYICHKIVNFFDFDEQFK